MDPGAAMLPQVNYYFVIFFTIHAHAQLHMLIHMHKAQCTCTCTYLGSLTQSSPPKEGMGLAQNLDTNSACQWRIIQTNIVLSCTTTQSVPKRLLTSVQELLCMRAVITNCTQAVRLLTICTSILLKVSSIIFKL